MSFTTYFSYAQSDSQIGQIKDFIKKNNLNESQARQMAKQQGYSDKEIDAVANKIKGREDSNLKTENIDKENEINIDQEPLMKSNNDDKLDKSLIDTDNLEKITELETDQKFSIKSLKHFGYDIFMQDPDLFQSSNFGVIDPDYLIGPSDEIIVMMWGETQFRLTLKVNREGFIFIPEVGQVFVNGLNLVMLESKLFKVLSQSYESLNPSNFKPSTFLDVSIGNLRPLRIQVLGEVSQPGAYTVSPSSTLFSSLYYFKGPTKLGSLRDIRLIRGGKQISSIDFYDYLITGKKPNDFKLQLDDIIFIPARKKTITIEGEVLKPGIYELKPQETLLDVINLAGDLKATAYSERAQIDRIVLFEIRSELGYDRQIIDLELNEIINLKKKFLLQDGDRIKIFPILESRGNTVTLEGAVTRPGLYELTDSLRLSSLITKAGGYLSDAHLERIELIRIGSENEEEIIRLNLAKALEGDLENNIILQKFDRIQIFSKKELVSEKFVSIEGYVKSPGTYPLRINMKISDLIFSSGGFIDEQFKKKTHFDRADLIRYDEKGITLDLIPINLGEILKNEDSYSNYLLSPGDKVRVYSSSIFDEIKSVSIFGSIDKPGSYLYKNDMKVKDLILESGGLSKQFSKYVVEIARVDPSVTNEEILSETFLFSMDNNYELISIGNGENQLSFKLLPYDYVVIRPDPNFAFQKKVSILGEVYYPGEYVIQNPSEDIFDLVQRAGGLKPNAYPLASTFQRGNAVIQLDLVDIIKNKSSKADFNLLEGDILTISTKPRLIYVQGEVNSPGIYKFQKKQRVNDVIIQAGGLTPKADGNSIYIKLPNGISKKYSRWINNSKVLDGSIIMVNAKEDEEPFDATEYAKEITAILANLAQVISLVIIANK